MPLCPILPREARPPTGSSVFGNASLLAGNAQVAATGLFEITFVSTGAVTGPVALVAGSGTYVVAEIFGNGAVLASSNTLAGEGAYVAPAIDGAGAVTPGSITVAGTGTYVAA